MNATADAAPSSVPRYAGGHRAQAATQRILVTQDGGDEAPAARRALSDSPAAPLTHLALPRHASLDALRQALARHLEAGQVGLRLELQGDEAFIWPLRNLARDAGLLDEEIVLHCTGKDRRLLFCVHCATLQPGNDASLQPCRQCGVVLHVRQHFSERLGAYLGVCADAELPCAQGRP